MTRRSWRAGAPGDRPRALRGVPGGSRGCAPAITGSLVEKVAVTVLPRSMVSGYLVRVEWHSAYFLMIANEHSGPGQITSFGQLSPVQVITAGSTDRSPSGVSSNLRAWRSNASDTFKR